MRTIIRTAVLIAMLAPAVPAQPFEPVNPNATREAKQLLKWMYQLQGNHTLTGMHDYLGNGAWEMELVHDSTGKYPAVFGTDLGFSAGSGYANPLDGVLARPSMLERVERYANEGCIIHMTWHTCAPLDPEPCTWDSSIQGDLTDGQWDSLFIPGTYVYEGWKARMDTAAYYLKAMDYLGIPVLWRPWHENNGGWFWWGGEPERFKRLWKQSYHYLTDSLHVDNLIWVWGPNQQTAWIKELASFYPGHNYVDMLGLDMYSIVYPQDAYDSLKAIAEGRLVSVTETKFRPSPALIDTQPDWSMIFMWTGKTTQPFRDDGLPWSLLYDYWGDPRVVTADGVAWDTVGVAGVGDRYVTSADGTLLLPDATSRIYSVTGQRVVPEEMQTGLYYIVDAVGNIRKTFLFK